MGLELKNRSIQRSREGALRSHDQIVGVGLGSQPIEGHGDLMELEYT